MAADSLRFLLCCLCSSFPGVVGMPALAMEVDLSVLGLKVIFKSDFKFPACSWETSGKDYLGGLRAMISAASMGTFSRMVLAFSS